MLFESVNSEKSLSGVFVLNAFFALIFSVIAAPFFYFWLFPEGGLEYETLLRIFAGQFLISWGLFLSGDSRFLKWLDGEGWRLGLGGSFVLAILLIFLFSKTPLRTEENAIRDGTAGALMLASILSFTGSVRVDKAWMKCLGIFLGLVFLFGAADERFEFHENIASTILYFYDIRYGTVDGLDFNAVQDATTLSYALAGLLALGLLLALAFWWGKKLSGTQASKTPFPQIEKNIPAIVNAVGLLIIVLAGILLSFGFLFTPEFASQAISRSGEIQDRVLPFINNFRCGLWIVGSLLLGAGIIWMMQRVRLVEVFLELMRNPFRDIGPGFLSAVPVRLFALAVILFACAMGLDTWDKDIARFLNIYIHPQDYATVSFSGIGIGVLFVDPAEMANFLEEVLEFSAAVCFVGMSGTLFFSETWRAPLDYGLLRFRVYGFIAHGVLVTFYLWLVRELSRTLT